MNFNYDKLRGRIREVYGSEGNFSKDLGLGRVSLSQRLNCKLEWTQSEINKSILLLHLEPSEIPTYFFTLKV